MGTANKSSAEGPHLIQMSVLELDGSRRHLQVLPRLIGRRYLMVLSNQAILVRALVSLVTNKKLLLGEVLSSPATDGNLFYVHVRLDYSIAVEQLDEDGFEPVSLIRFRVRPSLIHPN